MDGILQALAGLFLGTTADPSAVESCSLPLQQVVLTSSIDGSEQPSCAYLVEDQTALLVNLHPWSSDLYWVEDDILAFARHMGMSYIVPNARGPSDHPDACGSDVTVADIDDVISAYRDKAPVIVIGHSGGGFHALNQFLRGAELADFYSVWVPITDLGQWHKETKNRGLRYAEEIEKCTGLDPEELAHRSPISHVDKAIDRKTHVHISSGIFDGHDGRQVPISHAIRFYNQLAAAWGIDDLVEGKAFGDLLTLAVDWDDDEDFATIATFGGERLTLQIFEGGHQIRPDIAIKDVEHFVFEHQLEHQH